jgi:hypothetical protein
MNAPTRQTDEAMPLSGDGGGMRLESLRTLRDRFCRPGLTQATCNQEEWRLLGALAEDAGLVSMLRLPTRHDAAAVALIYDRFWTGLLDVGAACPAALERLAEWAWPPTPASAMATIVAGIHRKFDVRPHTRAGYRVYARSFPMIRGASPDRMLTHGLRAAEEIMHHARGDDPLYAWPSAAPCFVPAPTHKDIAPDALGPSDGPPLFFGVSPADATGRRTATIVANWPHPLSFQFEDAASVDRTEVAQAVARILACIVLASPAAGLDRLFAVQRAVGLAVDHMPESIATAVRAIQLGVPSVVGLRPYAARHEMPTEVARMLALGEALPVSCDGPYHGAFFGHTDFVLSFLMGACRFEAALSALAHPPNAQHAAAASVARNRAKDLFGEATAKALTPEMHRLVLFHALPLLHTRADLMLEAAHALGLSPPKDDESQGKKTGNNAADNDRGGASATYDPRLYAAVTHALVVDAMAF